MKHDPISDVIYFFQQPGWTTVFFWLLGHYVVAEYRVRGDADLAMQRLAVMRDHLFDAGLGTISEIFDADAPHLPGGAPSQAWSVACILETWWRLQQSKRAAANNDVVGGRAR